MLMRLIKEVPKHQIPLPRRFMQIARITLVTVVHKCSVFAVESVRPIRIGETRFQYEELQGMDCGALAEMAKSGSVINPQQFRKRIIRRIPISGSSVDFVHH